MAEPNKKKKPHITLSHKKAQQIAIKKLIKAGAKTLGYESAQKRTKADRWIKNLATVVQASGVNPSTRQLVKNTAKALEKYKQQTYQNQYKEPGKKLSKKAESQIRQANAQIDSIVEGIKQGFGKKDKSLWATNYVTKQMINLANRTEGDVLIGNTTFSKANNNIFFSFYTKLSASKHKTENGIDVGIQDNNLIYKNILDLLGTDSIQEAYEFTQEYVRAKAEQKDTQDTDISEEALEKFKELKGSDTSDSEQTSPPEVVAAIGMLSLDDSSVSEIKTAFKEWKALRSGD